MLYYKTKILIKRCESMKFMRPLIVELAKFECLNLFLIMLSFDDELYELFVVVV